MTGPEVFTVAIYFALCAVGLGLRRAGLEASAAGVVGLVLTAVHILVRSPNCQFDGANAGTAVALGILFLLLYFARDVIQGRGQDDTA